MMKLIVLLLAAIVAGGLAIMGSLFGATEQGDAQVTERPNFVFVMTDDLDERSMQDLGGIREVMGSNGTTFNNAYVTYSLCCPSRATILRGQYPHNHQILYNSPPLGSHSKFRSLGLDKSTIATWLNDVGYQTTYIGKYMNGYASNSLYKPPGWDEWFVLQGDPENNLVNDNGQSVALTGNSTDTFADETSDFIRRSAANPEPFFALIGTKAPHTPPEVPTRYQDSFATSPLPRPPNFNEADVSDKPAWVQKYKLKTQPDFDVFEKEYRNRLRSMLSVEDLLRQTITTLQETGELVNTYIFFTSDNGFHMGHHRFWVDKKSPYEEDIGVPLMVRGPGVPAGAVRDQLVINNDLAPTMADLAGASTPAFVDGSSFAPLLSSSPPSTWRTAFLEEGYIPPEDGFPVPPHKSVHTQRYMFTEYDTAERELYDLNADPYQLQSMSQADNEQLYSELGARLNGLKDCAGDACRAAEWTQPSASCTITGTANAETISGTSADDVICAGGGNDTVKGLGGNDALRGEAGNDQLLGGVGNDTLDGGFGTDTASYSASLTAVNASLATESATGEGSDTFLDVEDLLGSSKADTLIGSDTNNTINGGVGPDTEQGGMGNDTVIGGYGADILKGEDGNDTVNSQDGVSGNDSLYGGAGTDTKVTDATEKFIVEFP
jgi:N-acetylglucosamine-6-sulfatase